MSMCILLSFYGPVCTHHAIRGSRKLRQCVGGGGGRGCHFFINVFHRGSCVYLPREAIGPIVPRGVSVPIFLRKPIATCDFPGGPDPLPPPAPPPLNPPMNVGGAVICTSINATIALYNTFTKMLNQSRNRKLNVSKK